MTTLRRMSGTPWHKEKMTRPEGDDKRDRRKCVNFYKDNSHCSVYAGKCHGSAHCSQYKTVDKYICDSGKSGDKIYLSNDRAKRLFPVGSTVSHKKFGKGIVRKIDEEKIIISFNKGERKSFDLKLCLENGWLIKE